MCIVIQNVRLTFLTFEIESGSGTDTTACPYDSLRIYNGGELDEDHLIRYADSFTYFTGWKKQHCETFTKDNSRVHAKLIFVFNTASYIYYRFIVRFPIGLDFLCITLFLPFFLSWTYSLSMTCPLLLYPTTSFLVVQLVFCVQLYTP